MLAVACPSIASNIGGASIAPLKTPPVSVIKVRVVTAPAAAGWLPSLVKAGPSKALALIPHGHVTPVPAVSGSSN